MLAHLNLLEKEKDKAKPLILSDPKIIGPGIWVELHLKARLARTQQEKNEFVNHMWFLAETFPCLNCRTHINNYLNSHPFEDLWNLKNKNGEEIGMFKWSVMFHNAVNSRLRKPYMDWNTAWEMYDTNIEPCTKDCGSEEVELPDINIGNFNHISTGNLNSRPPDQIIQGYFLRKGIIDNLSKFS